MPQQGIIFKIVTKTVTAHVDENAMCQADIGIISLHDTSNIQQAVLRSEIIASQLNKINFRPFIINHAFSLFQPTQTVNYNF